MESRKAEKEKGGTLLESGAHLGGKEITWVFQRDVKLGKKKFWNVGKGEEEAKGI